MNTSIRFVFSAALLALVFPANADFSFHGLGDLPGGTFSSYANAASSDATVVVGHSQSTNGIEAFRWTSAGMVGLGALAGGPFHSSATGTNTDGSVVVGGSNSGLGAQAFIWTQFGGMMGIGDLPGGAFSSSATGVSGDGSIVVGGGTSADGPEAFKWTEADGIVGLGDLTGGSFYSYATAISTDGNVIVGYSSSANGFEAFRITGSGNMTGLGDLTGGGFSSSANAVSADGSTIVGQGTSASGPQAFTWTQSGGMVGLGDLAGGSFFSSATGVSADGAVVVGSSSGANGTEAFVWSSTLGMVSLKDYLIAHGVGGLTDWTLNQANGISGDGRTIFGYGTNPSGNVEAWTATVDVPRSVRVSAFSMFRGIVLSGGLTQLINSDDMWIVMRPGVVLSNSEAPIQLIVEATSPSSTLTQLTFQVESHADRLNLGQFISLYDFQAGAWVAVDTHNLTTGDQTVMVHIASNAARFLQPTTHLLRTRLAYRTVAPIFSYPWRISVDQTIWMIVP